MNRSLEPFDKFGAELISRIPRSFYRPFVWLGRMFTPVLWASYIVVVHVTWFTPGVLTGSPLLVIGLLPLASLIKLYFRRERPATVYVAGMRMRSYSFPSSHAYSASLGGGYLSLVCFLNALPLLGIAGILLALSIGVSRVHVGAHYPSDVLGGWLLGMFSLTIAMTVI